MPRLVKDSSSSECETMPEMIHTETSSSEDLSNFSPSVLSVENDEEISNSEMPDLLPDSSCVSECEQISCETKVSLWNQSFFAETKIYKDEKQIFKKEAVHDTNLPNEVLCGSQISWDNHIFGSLKPRFEPLYSEGLPSSVVKKEDISKFKHFSEHEKAKKNAQYPKFPSYKEWVKKWRKRCQRRRARRRRRQKEECLNIKSPTEDKISAADAKRKAALGSKVLWDNYVFGSFQPSFEPLYAEELPKEVPRRRRFRKQKKKTRSRETFFPKKYPPYKPKKKSQLEEACAVDEVHFFFSASFGEEKVPDGNPRRKKRGLGKSLYVQGKWQREKSRLMSLTIRAPKMSGFALLIPLLIRP